MEKIHFLKIEKNRVEFVLENVGVLFANGIRRTMSADVPTICVDVVIYEKNSGTMEEEFIAHRLGLIPWKKRKINVTEIAMIGQECQCDETEFCEKCSIKMRIDKTGTSSDKYAVLYSGDIVVENESIEPVYHNIPITKLGKYQRVAANMWAKKCIGRMHQKWSPVHTSAYNVRPMITLDHQSLKQMDPIKKKKLVKGCHARVFSYDENRDFFDIENADQCTYCGECDRKIMKWNMRRVIITDEYRKKEKLYDNHQHHHRINDDFHLQDFTFLVESKGSLNCLNVLVQSLDILSQKFDRLLKDVKKIV